MSQRLIVGPFNRVEGDLEVQLDIADGRVTQARVNATMYRGFEQMLAGRAPLDALVIVPRICGICGGSHLTKAVCALDTAWKTHVPHNATLIRNIAQACETLLSIRIAMRRSAIAPTSAMALAIASAASATGSA